MARKWWEVALQKLRPLAGVTENWFCNLQDPSHCSSEPGIVHATISCPIRQALGKSFGTLDKEFEWFRSMGLIFLCWCHPMPYLS